MKILRVLVLTAIALASLVWPASAENAQINGAGATFPFPIYSKWFSEYNKLHPEVQINYQSIGSGGESGSSPTRQSSSGLRTAP